MKNAAILDTNVFIHDPEVIFHLNEENFDIFIPWVVILELDNLKNKPDIGIDAREASRNIENNPNLLNIYLPPSFKGLKGLDKDIPDHQIIATAKRISENRHSQYKEITLFSKDRTVRILSSTRGINVADYTRDRVEETENMDLKTANVQKEDIIEEPKGSFMVFADSIKIEKEEELVENEGIVAWSDYNPFTGETGEWRKRFAMLKKGEYFKIIDDNIQAIGLKPFSMNSDEYNWHHHIAFAQILDPDIKLVFLQGGAGSGKTLLSIAGAIERRREFRRIAVTRPMIAVGDHDKVSTLPGDIKEKQHPWLLPIRQSINFLKTEVENGAYKKTIEDIEKHEKIYSAPLDYFRGTNFYKEFLLIDDAQNLTPHQVKTIITRAGSGTKIVFTGDLGQIDLIKKLDKHTSGLAYASSKMMDDPLTALTTFKETVRSDLVKLAEERL